MFAEQMTGGRFQGGPRKGKQRPNPHMACRDSHLHLGKFFMEDQVGGSDVARCKSFRDEEVLKGVAMFSYKFPVLRNTNGTMVITKAAVEKPAMTSRNTGVFMVKRVVLHKCSGASSHCRKGQYAADVMKVGYCLNCPMYQTKKGKRHIFTSTNALSSEDDKRRFLDKCVKHAFGPDGKEKVEYRCKEHQAKAARGVIAAF